MFNMLLMNTHDQNKAWMENWACTVLDLGINLAILWTIGLVLYWLWDFIDDKNNISIAEVLGGSAIGFITLSVLGYAGTHFVLFICLIFAHTLYIIPLVYYYSTFGIVLTIFTARYGRRTHKAIHKHVEDPNAHTEKAEPMSHKCTDDMLSDYTRRTVYCSDEPVRPGHRRAPLDSREHRRCELGKVYLCTWEKV